MNNFRHGRRIRQSRAPADGPVGRSDGAQRAHERLPSGHQRSFGILPDLPEIITQSTQLYNTLHQLLFQSF